MSSRCLSNCVFLEYCASTSHAYFFPPQFFAPPLCPLIAFVFCLSVTRMYHSTFLSTPSLPDFLWLCTLMIRSATMPLVASSSSSSQFLFAPILECCPPAFSPPFCLPPARDFPSYPLIHEIEIKGGRSTDVIGNDNAYFLLINGSTPPTQSPPWTAIF